jgi:hypothetical protein
MAGIRDAAWLEYSLKLVFPTPGPMRAEREGETYHLRGCDTEAAAVDFK